MAISPHHCCVGMVSALVVVESKNLKWRLQHRDQSSVCFAQRKKNGASITLLKTPLRFFWVPTPYSWSVVIGSPADRLESEGKCLLLGNECAGGYVFLLAERHPFQRDSPRLGHGQSYMVGKPWPARPMRLYQKNLCLSRNHFLENSRYEGNRRERI